MGVRQRWWPAVAVAVSGGALALTPLLGWQTSVPTAVGLGFVAQLAATRSTAPAAWHAAGLCTGVLSLVGTADVLRHSHRPNPALESWGLVETALLIGFVAASVRWGRGPVGLLAVVVTVSAQVLWILRIIPDRTAGAMAVAAAFWSAGSWVAAFVGGYPRYAAWREQRSVTTARAQQRRRLERDLHDYVAHDVSGILAQAQAAQFAAPDDPKALRRLLARIEGSAHNALTAMDRTMELLREDEADASTTPVVHEPDLGDLPGVVAAFASATAADVRCDFGVDPSDIPRPVSVTAQRVAIEALTNVRRHAPLSTTVTVRVTADAGADRLVLDVENTLTPDHPMPPDARTGGTGLDHARHLVNRLGGELEAGPCRSGWTVRALLPIGRAGAHQGEASS